MNHPIMHDKMIAIVPVRSGSKGLPGKNTRKLAGLPLYQHALQQGTRTVGQALLSTDIEGIDAADLPPGARLVKRPSELATDTTPMADVIRHLIETQALEPFTLVLLQATTPLRSDEDIARAIELYQEGNYELVMSVVEKDRSILKYGLLQGDEFQPMREPEYCFQNRQQLPAVYAPNGAVYVFSARDFIEAGGFPSHRMGVVKMPADRSIDIDRESDFELAEKALQKPKSKS
ncbi:acylneuraminate cytidylyltransferase family protein [Marinobacter nauticus]